MSIEAQVQVFYRNIELMEATLEWREEGGFLHTRQPMPVGTSVQLRRPGMDDFVAGRVTHVVEMHKKGRNDDAPASGMMLSFIGEALFAQVDLVDDTDQISTKLEKPREVIRAVEDGDDDFVDPDVSTPVVDPEEEVLQRIASSAGEDDEDLATETEDVPQEEALKRTPTVTGEDEALEAIAAEQGLGDTPTMVEDPSAVEHTVEVTAADSVVQPSADDMLRPEGLEQQVTAPEAEVDDDVPTAAGGAAVARDEGAEEEDESGKKGRRKRRGKRRKKR